MTLCALAALLLALSPAASSPAALQDDRQADAKADRKRDELIEDLKVIIPRMPEGDRRADLYFQLASSTTCAGDATTLCLGALRFKVTATFDAGNGFAGDARAVPLTGDTGYFWFFSSTNVEIVVKVIDGCGLGGHFWVFAGGLTNVRTVITVTDATTGAVRTYTNLQGHPFAPLQDTSAFACP